MNFNMVHNVCNSKIGYIVLYTLFLNILLPRHFNPVCVNKKATSALIKLFDHYHAGVVIAKDLLVCNCYRNMLELLPKRCTTFKACMSGTERSLT